MISDRKLRQLYAAMLKCRMLDERARALFERSKLSYEAAAGQEAAAVGTAIDLRGKDAVGPPPGSSGARLVIELMRGAPLDKIFGRRLARASEKKGRSSPIHSGNAPFDEKIGVIPVATTMAGQLSLATGVALAGKLGKKTRKSDAVTVAYSADEAAPPEDWHEALRFAGAHELPMIFVTLSDPRAKSALSNAHSPGIPEAAEAFGVPAIAVDGSDAVAVYRVASEAIARARRGHGPALIEARVWGGRLGVDPAHDPLTAMEAYLAGKGLFSLEWKRKIADGFRADLAAATKLLRY